MSKRGYKLQEFVAHSGNVNCLNIGKKACRLFLTGGDDHKVNLWAIGKPNSLMSLCGHTSPVDSVAFDSAEVMVLGGASSGVIKLWDLEEAKMVRGLTGHRSNCTAVEFHPFGEFFASGSMDTNLKIWDIRKKGCIHTYKGHTRGISTIRFTPDGRWVVSGGFDNVVKVWDLTAGKLLHDFKYHESHIRSIDFHPLEFLLATGSADRTVKFWDLETFELIGSSRPEATGVRAITFHPDGRTLFCGLDDALKVYSWEPVICHDGIDMGWSTLGDLCIHEGKFLGCSYYQNSVGIWVADISLIEPYGASLSKKDNGNNELNVPRSHSSMKGGTGIKSTLASRCVSPDSDTKEIKNIYVDTADGNPVSPQRVHSLNSPKVSVPLNKYTTNVAVQRQGSVTETLEKSDVKVIDKSLASANGESRESMDGKDSSHSLRRESITFSRTKPGMLLRPAHSRRPSNTKYDTDRLSNSADTSTPSITLSADDSPGDLDSKTGVAREEKPGEPCGENLPLAKTVPERFDEVLSLQSPKPENCDKPHVQSEGVSSVKIVNGVAVVSGRTRTLVERFERRERLNSSEEQAITITQSMIPREEKTFTSGEKNETKERLDNSRNQTSCMCDVTPDVDKMPSSVGESFTINERLKVSEDQVNTAPRMIPVKDKTPTSLVGSFQRRERVTSMDDTWLDQSPVVDSAPTMAQITPEVDKAPPALGESFEGRERFNISEKQATVAARAVSAKDRTAPGLVGSFQRRERFRRTNDQIAPVLPRTLPTSDRQTIFQAERFERVEKVNSIEDQATHMSTSTVPETVRAPITQGKEPQISTRESESSNNVDATETLMQSHEGFLSTLRSRLTKLQVVRHFCDRNDMKGAINAMRKLPDHSVQADVISVLMEKMEILNLDLFSCLLPVLIDLLDSKTERHTVLSLEMLLKLVAVFGSVVHVTVSAPPTVGVDLHAEQRRECCNQCFMQLKKIQKILPLVMRRGGVIAKSAQELNLVLQQT